MEKNENISLIISIIIFIIILINIYIYESKEALLGAAIGCFLGIIIYLIVVSK